ncbi:MAG: hypothetical protein J7M13_09295 [Synergistetes bacterium]|nr:hypothetical protein [Synergistota bacterium]
MLSSLDILEYKLRTFLSASKVAIFGASGGGRRALLLMRKVGKTPIAFLDNDNTKWGNLIEGVKVFPPTDLGVISPEVVVIASVRRDEILKQIYAMEYSGVVIDLGEMELLVICGTLFKIFCDFFCKQHLGKE